MRSFVGMTKRNLLLYFKDVQAVIFSLLTSIIVFVLYLLFLKGTFVDAINSYMKGIPSDLVKDTLEMLVNEILLTGILGSAMITIPYNCLQTIVRDREQKIDFDISATPMKRCNIILSYFVSSALSSFLMTSGIFVVGLLALRGMGEVHMSVQDVALAFVIILMGSVSATAIFMIMMMFFKTASSSGAFFGILSAASGFVIGAYIPISQFSEAIQTACNLFPASHITIMMRNVLLNGTLDAITDSLHGMDHGMVAEGIKDCFTFEAAIFGHSFDMPAMGLYVVCLAVLSIVIMILTYSKTYKRK